MKIFILGTGRMGKDISQLFAINNDRVFLYTRNIANKDIILKNIISSLDKDLQKGKITSRQREIVIHNIKVTSNLQDASECDLVIEAIVENIDLKKDIFMKLDNICNENTIFASNTSSLSITDMASKTRRMDKFIGIHFFNPAKVMNLVEVIDTLFTSEETKKIISDKLKEIKKEIVYVNESPGFIVNRILVPMINEAICILAEGIAKKEDIDKAMVLGANHPIGPLYLADLIGLDVCLAIMETLYSEFNDNKYRPSPYLRKLVRSNFLGRKTKKGFYNYN